MSQPDSEPLIFYFWEASSDMFLLKSVQLLNHVQLFVTLWTAAHQPSLSITNSQSLLKLISIELVMPSNHLTLCHPLLLLLSVFPSININTHTHTHTPFRSRKTMNRRKMNFFGKILNMHFFENCYKIDPLSNKLKIILIAR